MTAEQISILLVDDEEAIRQVFTRFLELRGYKVFTCATAEEGLLLARDMVFDVVVTDLKLPDATGLALAEHLKEIAPQAKVILLTGAPSEETLKRANQLSVARYLAKPIRASRLIEVVEEVLLENTEPG